MMTTTMKWVSAMALFTAAIWRPSASFQILLEFLVCMSALLAVAQAWRARKYAWLGGFLSIAVLFNPAVPVVFSRGTFVGLYFACVATFLISLVALKTQPQLSVAGIIHPDRLNESL